MATVYEVKITSHWINHHPKDLEKIIQKALYSEGMNETKTEVLRVDNL